MAKTSKSIKLARKTASVLIVESLKERFMNHEFAESEIIRQERLAKEYNVSLSPVREALIQLEAEGLVTSVRHRGYQIAALSIENLQELYELRTLIEVALLAHAIPKLQESDLTAARKLHETMEKISQGGKQPASWSKINWEFHCSLYRPAGRTQLLAVTENAHVKVTRYIHMERKMEHTVDLERSVKEHAALLASCESRDARKATEILSSHLAGASRDLAEFLNQHEQPQD